jgi:multiple sugar transport system substrate-binding protein
MKLAIGLRGVHSLMTFFTLCANLGKPCAMSPREPFADLGTTRAALEHLRDLLALCPREALDWNSIALHDVMAARDDLVFCRRSIAMRRTPRPTSGARCASLFSRPCGPRGSTIGGTALGISAHCANPEAP